MSSVSTFNISADHLVHLPAIELEPGIELISIHICVCVPSALQLLTRGLFSCAPMVPSLAVDIAMLCFACELFVRLPPNMTSFSEAMESFLASQGYELKTKVCIQVILHHFRHTSSFLGFIMLSLSLHTTGIPCLLKQHTAGCKH